MDLENLCPHCMRERQEGQKICPHCGKDVSQEAEVQHQLKPFTILQGKYLVGDVIGEGGFGITYIGFDLNLETRVAIKEFYPNGYVTREAQVTSMLTAYTGQSMETVHKWRDSFVKEARALAKFTGLSGIVGVKDFFQENNTAYIIMEYLEGETLKSHMKNRGGRIPAEELLYMMKPVIASLDEVHKAGLIHRDISPDNLMLLKGGQIKLLDFGAARDYTADGEKSLSVLLKPGYAPEEQYRTRGKQGPWSDVYALCATMYKCITGVTPPESMERMREDELKHPGELGIAVSPRVEDALARGMAVFAEDRCQSMSELYDMLYGSAGEQSAGGQDMKAAGQKADPAVSPAARQSAADQNVDLTGQSAAAQDTNLSEQSPVEQAFKTVAGKLDKDSILKWIQAHKTVACGVAGCLAVLLIAVIAGSRSGSREPEDALQAGTSLSGQNREDGAQDSGEGAGTTGDNVSLQYSPEDSEKDLEMYEAFLRNELPVAQGGYDASVGGYYLSDFIENTEVLFGEFGQGYPVRSVQYAYIDCGKVGKSELAVRFEINDMEVYSDSAVIFLLFRVEDQLVCCYSYDDAYRNWTELNEYGFLDNSEYADALSSSESLSFVSADGKWNALVTYGMEMGYHELQYTELARLADVIDESGGLPEGVYLNVKTITLEAAGDLAEEKYYTYEVQENGNVLKGDDIYSGGYYKEAFDRAGIPFCTPAEIEQMVNARADALGVTEEIRNGAAVEWTNLDISPYVTFQEDTAIHWYELILADVTWEQAYDDCLSRGGYLARINTREEFDAICSQILAEEKSRCMFWLGAKRDEGSSEYYWVNEYGQYFGDPLNGEAYMDFWLPGEPSFSGSSESGATVSETCMDMLYRSSEGRFYWNDAPENVIAAASFYAGRVGYICEYE